MYETDIVRAARGEISAETAVGRIALKLAIQQQPVCPYTQRNLAPHEAVHFEISRKQQRGANTVHCSWWDEVGSTLAGAAVELGADLTVLDGRALFKGDV